MMMLMIVFVRMMFMMVMLIHDGCAHDLHDVSDDDCEVTGTFLR
jgi:hypothetical protein